MINIKTSILFLLIFSLSACNKNDASESSSPSKAVVGEIQNIDVPTFKSLMTEDSKVVLDVRTPKEIANGMIQGAIHIDFYDADFDNKINKLDKSKEYLVYCKSGNRSGKTAGKMQSAGFSKIYNLQGGYTAWSAASN